MIIFYFIVECCWHYSQVISSLNCPETKVVGRKFWLVFALDLMEKYLTTRYTILQVPNLTKLRIAEILGIENQNNAPDY